jgi:hypothetical protein
MVEIDEPEYSHGKKKISVGASAEHAITKWKGCQIQYE